LRFFCLLPGFYDHLCLSDGSGLAGKMDGGRDISHGIEYRHLHYASWICDNGEFHGHYTIGEPVKNARPADILGGIAMVGLLVYALIYGMDATISSMLTGLFGVLLGRSMKSDLETLERKEKEFREP
jgi:hypothetical protein